MTAPRPPSVEAARGEAEDLGTPVAAIAALEYQPAPGFMRKVRGRIGRRILGRHVADFTWSAPRLVFLAFLELLFGSVGRDDAQKGDGARWNR